MTAPHSGTDLTEKERQVVQSYLSDTSKPLRRQKSISVRYALGGGLLMLAAFWFDAVWLTVPVYLVFVVWLVLRYRALQRRSAELARIFTAFQQTCEGSGPGRENTEQE